MRKVLAVLIVLLIAGAFAAGYWPERQRASRAQAEATALRAQLSEAQARLAAAEAKARLGRLFGQLLALQDAVASGNFGEAQTFSSAFFDGVLEESRTTDAAEVRAALDAVLTRRDTVTAGLARGEGSVSTVLAPIERDLRRALGYPVPPPSPSARAAGPGA
jgi:type II secretory pathway pseudopilin PulG